MSHHSRPHITIDFETRSEADLKKVGTGRYSEDPSTEAKMLCWAVDDGPVHKWRGPVWLEVGGWPDDPPHELFYAIKHGALVEAHNAFFERMIWRNICIPRFGWPDIPDEQWRCSAAKAAAVSLPRGLKDAAQAMQVPIEKDMEGHKLMLRLCKPRSQWFKWKNGGMPEEPEPQKYFQSLEEFERELDYCAQDVETERALSKRLPDLKKSEWEVWQVDQRMNARGIKCDIPFAKHMIRIIGEYRDHMRSELEDLTEGEITKETQRARVLDWFLRNDTTLPDEAGNWHAIENTQAATLKEIADIYGHEVRGRVAGIVQQLNKSSVSKYTAMVKRASEDDHRARDTLLFHGASTGRFSGRGIQLQNVPSGKVKNMEDAVDTASRVEGLIDILAEYEEPMEAFSGLIRGALMAEDDHELVVADYSAIEARGVMWLAREHTGLQVFRNGDCIYCDMATDIYGWKVDKVKAKSSNHEHSEARSLGKRAVLGLGFMMSAPKFLQTCEKGGQYFTDYMVDKIVPSLKQEMLEEDIRGSPVIYFPKRKQVVEEKVKPLILSKFVVDRYRSRYGKVRDYWYSAEDAAKRAIREHKQRKPNRDWVYIDNYRGPGEVGYKVIGAFLFCKLPSKRHIAYPYPNLKMKKTAWGEEKETITFWGVDSFTHRWCEQMTYGGKLCENITQGTARDVMAEALIRVDRHPVYTPVLSVHDELVNEALKGQGSAAELEQIMAEVPKWARGFPIEVEGWLGTRYRK